MTIKVQKCKYALVRKGLCFEVIHFKLKNITCWGIPGGKFLGQYGTCLCLSCSNQMCFVSISDSGRFIKYEEGRKCLWSEVIRTSIWIWKWMKVTPYNILRNKLKKRGMCRCAFYPWWSAWEFSWGRTVVRWKFPQRRDTHPHSCKLVHFHLFAISLSSK
jgi:hypothetical protein